MASLMEIMQLCRLCLVKDQVNIPIFEEQGDIRQIFLKISACLPVKVSREDNLPKKICDGCSYKLEILYQFWNTSANSEKQLLKWLSQVGAEKSPTSDKVAVAPVQPHSMPSDGVILKQEVVDLADSHSADEIAPDDLNVSSDAQDYILQQQQLPYQPIAFQFPQDGFAEGEGATNASGPSATVTSEAAEAAPPKRKRRAAAMKALPPQIDSEEEDEDDVDMVETKIAKTEEQTDESGGEDPEPTAFVGVPSTSTDNEQPGPSGVGKGSAEAPFDPLTETTTEAVSQTIYECEVCTQIFSTKKDFLAHHMNQFGETFRCCRCDNEFKTTTELYNHYQLHKNGAVIIEHEESTEFDYSENVEAVMNIPNEPINDTDELLYILDGSQCINEVVIEEESEGQEMETDTSAIKPENFTIVQVEHGYMLPSVFKGQLESKRRYKKRESLSLTESFTEEDSGTETTVIKPEPVPSRNTYVSSSAPKSRPKRRHEVPDFSATNYVVLNPNEEVDIPHYKCLRCEQLFISKFTFFRHIEKGKCYINSCDVCSASFNRNSEFYDHYLAEHTDRAICNFCFRTFMYEKNVKEHMLRHLDQFRHRCEECNKGFYTVREYRNHYKNRHMGIRHKCDVCGRSFADEYYFKRHVATHEKALAAKVELSVYK